MKISTKGEYALEIVVDLALHADKEHPESLKNIAFRRNLSEKYLERIIKSLKEGGIVLSLRGARGGYCLAVPASSLTVKQVLLASEGALAPVECLTKETDCGIACEKCPTRPIWNEVWNRIISVVEDVKISEITGKISDFSEK